MNSSGTNAVNNTAERSNLRNLVQIGMLGAVSVVLMMFEMPLFFAPSFYKIDLSEIPVLIGTFAMGPVAGMFIELIKVVLHMLFKGSSTAGVGDFANFLVGCAMIVPAGLIYQKKKSKKSAVVGMIIGIYRMLLKCFCAASGIRKGIWYAGRCTGCHGNGSESGNRQPAHFCCSGSSTIQPVKRTDRRCDHLPAL